MLHARIQRQFQILSLSNSRQELSQDAILNRPLPSLQDTSYFEQSASDDELERKIAEEHVKFKEAVARRQEEASMAAPVAQDGILGAWCSPFPLPASPAARTEPTTTGERIKFQCPNFSKPCATLSIRDSD